MGPSVSLCVLLCIFLHWIFIIIFGNVSLFVSLRVFVCHCMSLRVLVCPSIQFSHSDFLLFFGAMCACLCPCLSLCLSLCVLVYPCALDVSWASLFVLLCTVCPSFVTACGSGVLSGAVPLAVLTMAARRAAQGF